MPARLDELTRSGRPAPRIAASITAEVQTARPDAELLAWWLADLAIAGWPVAVLMLITQVRGAAFRSHGFALPFQHLRHEGAGHTVKVPYGPTPVRVSGDAGSACRPPNARCISEMPVVPDENRMQRGWSKGSCAKSIVFAV